MSIDDLAREAMTAQPVQGGTRTLEADAFYALMDTWGRMKEMQGDAPLYAVINPLMYGDVLYAMRDDVGLDAYLLNVADNDADTSAAWESVIEEYTSVNEKIKQWQTTNN